MSIKVMNKKCRSSTTLLDSLTSGVKVGFIKHYSSFSSRRSEPNLSNLLSKLRQLRSGLTTGVIDKQKIHCIRKE
ncbi:hypothetical protein EUGRSUZ_K01220 [Eucalyptus grandis]|uniref:Uncharacterized protein n=2 Tax=Eucalyptus grandis TaxID=71139 RepID=A0ACC3ITL5_EUCGR|nr:hypothetical protein EUGRSUZ_K01220 [Eucalyptus grandis]